MRTSYTRSVRDESRVGAAVRDDLHEHDVERGECDVTRGSHGLDGICAESGTDVWGVHVTDGRGVAGSQRAQLAAVAVAVVAQEWRMRSG